MRWEPASRALLLAGLAFSSFACAPATSPRPSVVLVMVDTLRADYLGCYGFDGPVSPNVDRLAAEGVVFERCHAQAPWTKPSIATVFTSLYPSAHRVVTHEGWFGDTPASEVKSAGDGAAAVETDVLPAEARTLAEAFERAGYRTGAFVANPWIRRAWGFAQGFGTFEEYEGRNGGALLADALAWLEAEPEAPSLLYVHLMDVHGPYDAPETDFDAVAASAGLGPEASIDGPRKRPPPAYLRLSPWTKEPDARSLKTWRGRYAAGVHAMDRRLGAFVDGLRASGRLDRTVLALTSDHGEELQDHGGWDHGSNLYEHQTHVPWIVRLPAAHPRAAANGTRRGELTELVDVMPTLLALAGVRPDKGVQGQDRLAHDAAGTVDPPGAYSVAGAIKWRPQTFSLRTDEHKLVADLDSGKTELFHLATDPTEQRNLASRQTETVRHLMGLLREHLATASRGALRSETATVSETLRDRLNDLGY